MPQLPVRITRPLLSDIGKNASRQKSTPAAGFKSNPTQLAALRRDDASFQDQLKPWPPPA
jgi:hypothetical protein